MTSDNNQRMDSCPRPGGESTLRGSGKTEDACPCCSGQAFAACCEPYLLGKSLPPTPQALMRSRYTAFATANVEYIFATMAQRALKQADPDGTKEWAERCTWLGLEVIAAPEAANNEGIVEFIAKYTENGQEHRLHERSRFRKSDGKWYYVGEAVLEAVTNKTQRNEPCPCGSGKKYKKCCLTQQEKMS